MFGLSFKLIMWARTKPLEAGALMVLAILSLIGAAILPAVIRAGMSGIIFALSGAFIFREMEDHLLVKIHDRGCHGCNYYTEKELENVDSSPLPMRHVVALFPREAYEWEAYRQRYISPGRDSW